MSKFKGSYTHDWPKIAKKVKTKARWRCVRCGHRHETVSKRHDCDELCDDVRHVGGLNDGRLRVLTVHHLDGNKSNNAWWNLLALCQVCHLKIQAKVDIQRPYIMLEHSDWFKPYVAGWYAYRYLGQNLSRKQVVKRLDELLQTEVEVMQLYEQRY